MKDDGAVKIPLSKLKEFIPVKDKKRYGKSSIKELASNILALGLQYPLKVVKENDHYLVVDGNRRLAAIRYLVEQGHSEFEQVPCEVLDIKVDNSLLFTLINQHQEKWSPIALARLIKLMLSKGMKKKDIAKALGKSKGYVSLLSKLADLPPDIQKQVEEGKITPRQAYDMYVKKQWTKKKEAEEKRQREVIEKVVPKKVQKVRTCFICHSTFPKDAVQVVHLCPACISILMQLVKVLKQHNMKPEKILDAVQRLVQNGGERSGSN